MEQGFAKQSKQKSQYDLWAGLINLGYTATNEKFLLLQDIKLECSIKMKLFLSGSVDLEIESVINKNTHNKDGCISTYAQVRLHTLELLHTTFNASV